jgi:hypothetical protein
MKTDMITEDEFKDLTDSLEVVGHYDPSVKDMLTHIKASPVKWVHFSVHYKEVNPAEYKSEIKPTNFPGSGRFEKAIREFATRPDKFSSVLEEMGMKRNDVIKGDNFYEVFISKVPS